MSVLLTVPALAVDANPAPPISSGRTPLMRHTDNTEAAAAAAAAAALAAGPAAAAAGDGDDVCVPVAFQNADATEVTTDCLRCWYCCVTDCAESTAAAEGVLDRCC